jgi:hypothetical protein
MRATIGGPVALACASPTETVIELDAGEVLSTHQIDPTRAYWRNQNREPGRWPPPQN